MFLVVANDLRMGYVLEDLAQFFDVVPYGKEMDVTKIKYAVLPFKVCEVEMKELVAQLREDCVIFTPIMRSFLEGIPQHIEVIMDQDEIAIYNSIPTAEGVIYYLIKNTQHTIHNANVHVIGGGRCGETLAKSLKALGARVTISSRNPKLAARLFESGIRVVTTDSDILGEADVVVNTVPALVLEKQALSQMKSDVYVVDIATAPGGVDFQAANALGIKAELLPALPSIVAPKTAAKYLSTFIVKTVNQKGKFSKNDRL